MPERPPVGESQSNGIIERGVGLVAGQARTLKAALEHRVGARVPPDARILCWLVELGGILMNRCGHRQGRKDTTAKTTRAKGQHTDSGVWRKDPVHARPNQREEESRSRGSTQECLSAC